MDLRLNAKRALVTGAAGGIGAATAERLAEEGARLFLTDVDEGALAGVRDRLGAEGEAADLSTTEGAEALARKAASGGAIDIFVHAAGVTGAKGDPLAMTDENWDHAWHTDFMSGVRLARVLGPKMVERGWGRMVFVTSENAAQPYADETVYNVAKIGLASFAKSISMQHAKAGLLANCVAPAFVETPMTDGMMEQKAEAQGTGFDETVEGFLKEERPFLALGRRGRPDEVAPVIALLCSDLASYVVGANWRGDGGSVASIEL
ncbi:MAG: SDR family NAD(P)-dependent oxidoreductase [Paracoccaceae bacterium]